MAGGGGDPLRKVNSGEPFVPSAATWNSFIDTTNWVRQNANYSGGQTPSIQVPPGCVLVKASADLDRFQPVSIGSAIYTATSSDATKFDYWRNNTPVFAAGTIAATDENTFGIVQEPLKSGRIGIAMIRGITPAKVNIVSTSYMSYATIKPSSSTTKLYSQSWGSSQILQRESSGTGDKWCLVDLHTDRYHLIGGKLTGSLSVGGTQTINVYSDGSTSTSETLTIWDKYSEIGSTIGSPTMVDGIYDCAIQKALFQGMKC